MKAIESWLMKRTWLALRQRGQALVEYGLIFALVAIVAVAGLNAFAVGVGGLNDVLKAVAAVL